MEQLCNFLFWFIGFNAAFFIFRDAFSIIKLTYTAAICLLSLLSIYRLFEDKRTGNLLFSLKLFGIIMALLLCFVQYNNELFTRELIGTASLFLMWGIFFRYPSNEDCRAYLKGYKLSVAIDFVYSGIQLFILLTFKININNYLLFYIVHSTQISTNVVSRIAGLCWDPYVLGIFCATGFFLFKSKIIKIYILVLLYFSSSRAGQLGLFVACIFYYLNDVKKRLNMKNIFLLFLILPFIPIAIPFVIKTLDLDRGFNKKSVGWRRVEHIICLPDVVASDKTIFPLLFGGAPTNNGARFYYSNISCKVNETIKNPYWAIESDWFSLIYGRGVLGFFIYFYFYFYIFAHSKNRLLKTLSLCFFAAGIGYYFEFAIFSNFILFFALNKKSKKLIL